MIYLMLQKSPLVYYILNSNTDYIGSMHNGKPSIMHTECIASADNMSDLLHQLQNMKCGKWYVETDWIGSDGKYRHNEYPIHQGLHRLDGFIKEVCDIRKDDKCYLRDWEIDFISELWVKYSDGEITLVRDFNKNMLMEVEKYMTDHELFVKGISKLN